MSLILVLTAWLRPQTSSAAVPPYPVRVSANGFAAVSVNAAAAKVDGFWPHLYAHRSPAETTPNLLFDAYFGLAVGAGAHVWTHTLPQPTSGDVFGYVDGTCVHDTRTLADVTLETVTCAPMTLPWPGAVMVARVTNTGSASQAVTLAALGNFHLGPPLSSQDPTPGADGETLLALDDRTLVEADTGTPHKLLYLALGPTPTTLETTNPWQKWQDGQAFSSQPTNAGNDRVAGMQWPMWTLAPGQTQSAGWLLLYGEGTADAAMQTAAQVWVNGRGPDAIYADEAADWAAWHQQGQVPAGTDVAWVQRQLATVRGAQVREPNTGAAGQNQTPHGQIVASLPPGIWHIAWLRDMAYAGVALAASGHVAEARAALDFVLAGQTGGYTSYMGGAYLITPVRYYGGGLEESDSDQNGPNIEFDGLGLWLWQAKRYVDASQDTAWVQQRWPEIRDLVANRLVALRDPTGLLGKDSGPWEVHWNGKQKHFAYTTVVGIRGLCGAADLADLMGDGAQAQTWRQVAVSMRAAVQTHLVGADNVLRGNMEEPAGLALDAAAVEAFLDGQQDPGGAVALATWTAWKQKLSAAGVGPGLARNDDGGEYDSAEWLFIDARVLRMLERMLAAGQPVGADVAALQARVQDIVAAGGGVVPELMATTGAAAGTFAGAIPMVGFGAGATALWAGGEAWGDDLTACFAPPAVVEPGPDAGSSGGDDTAAAADSTTGEDAATEVDSAPADLTTPGDDAETPDTDDAPAPADMTVADTTIADTTGAESTLDTAAGPTTTDSANRATGCTSGRTGAGVWPVLWTLCVLWRARRTTLGAS